MRGRWAWGWHCLSALASLGVSPSCQDTLERSAPRGGAPSALKALGTPSHVAPAQPAPRGPLGRQTPGLRVRRGTLPAPYAWDFAELSIDLSRVSLSLVEAPAGLGLLPELPQGAWAWVNGGYFDSEQRPTSWVRSGGRDWTRKRRSRSGGVLLVQSGRGYVGPNWDLPFDASFALQSSPLILEPQGRPGIRTDDGRRAARTFVCQGDSPSELRFVLVLAAIGSGPTLFECMDIARRAPPAGFGCQVALNLDGGPSTGVRFAPAMHQTDSPPRGPVAYAIAFWPKQPVRPEAPGGGNSSR